MDGKKYWNDHLASLKFWATHGGPHILWLGGVVIFLYTAGIIDKPAWSGDISALKTEIGSIQSDVKDVKAITRQLQIDRAAEKEQNAAQSDKLRSIDQKLNILINRGLDTRRR